MNFTPFSGQFQSAAAAAMPTIHQFAAKFGYEGGGVQETRYPVQLVDGVKFRPGDGLVVVTAAQPVTLAAMPAIHTVNTGVKYQTISASSSMNLGNIAYGGQTSYVQAEAVQLKERDKRDYREDHHHDIMATMMHQHQVTQTVPMQQGGQQLVVVLHEPKEAAAIARAIKQEARSDRNTTTVPAEFISIGDVSDSSTWQSLGGGVADYLSTLPLPLHHLLKYSSPNNTVIEKREETPTIVTPVSTTPLPSINTLAKQRFAQIQPNTVNSVVVQTTTIVNQNISASPPLQNVVTYANNNNNNNVNNNINNNINTNNINSNHNSNKKKKKRKGSGTNVRDKPERARPGEIRLTTALDGSTLYCCPECHMAYPERGLLEQHLLGHTMERRYICDICNAALKRKDHLTRHKQSHNPERPHVCSVCLKAFKRKEQLTLHFVIHSGEKRHVCNECGKGFYRKDHLRKHSRSHIARRVKAELSQTLAPAPLPPAASPDVS